MCPRSAFEEVPAPPVDILADMRYLCACSALVASTLLWGQSHYHVDHIAALPSSPTDQNSISPTLSGSFSGGGVVREPFSQGSAHMLAPFLLEPCFDPGSSVPGLEIQPGLVVTYIGDRLLLSEPSAAPFGTLRLTDIAGRIVLDQGSNSPSTMLHTGSFTGIHSLVRHFSGGRSAQRVVLLPR